MECGGIWLSKACEANNIEAVKLLLASPRIDMDNMEDYCLHYAISNENREMVRLLLDGQVDPEGDVHSAVRTGDIEIVRMLLQGREDRTGPIVDEESHSCLYLAIDGGFSDIADLLLTCVDRDDPEAFQLACSKEYLHIAAELLPTVSGQASLYLLESTLFRACKFGSLQLVSMLLSIEALDPSVKDNRALMLASRYQRDDIARMLLLDERVAQLAER